MATAGGASTCLFSHEYLEIVSADIRLRFRELDKDNNGALAFDEMYKSASKKAKSRSVEAREKMHAFFAEIDKDGSGQVSFDEFAGYALPDCK